MRKFLLTILAACACLAGYSQDTLHVAAQDTAKDIQMQPLFKDSASAGPDRIRLGEVVGKDGSDKMMDDNGNVWKAFTRDGVDVLMNVRFLKNYGKYYRMDFYIQNNTDSTLHYDFKNTRISSMDGPIRLYSRSDYLGRVHSKKTWREIGIGVSTFFIGLFTMAMIEGIADDSELGADLADIAVNGGIMVLTDLYFMKQNENLHEIKRESIGYMRDYDIKPYTAIDGHAMARYDRDARTLQITLPIGGQDYVLDWDASHLEPIATD